jgi:hypothetical protein
MSTSAVSVYHNRELRINVAGAETDILNEAAFQAEGLAKQTMVANDSIDTGFALNTIHAIPVASDGIPGTVVALTDRDGRTVLRESDDLPGMDEHSSGVGIGASYGVYIELDQPFLFPAAEQVAREMGATVERVGRRRGLKG